MMDRHQGSDLCVVPSSCVRQLPRRGGRAAGSVIACRGQERRCAPPWRPAGVDHDGL